jgi:uncharacterized glyoxalase superfamily protein PhnB
VAAAIDWLVAAFDFKEHLRELDEDGTVGHAELDVGRTDGVVMLSRPTSLYRSPRHHAQECAAAARWLEIPYIIDGVVAYVDDVETHFERARRAGATLLSEIEDAPYGIRAYRVEDLEGHRWMFAQHVRDVRPEEWGAIPAPRPGEETRQPHGD